MKTFWCLYRESPFRVLFEEGGRSLAASFEEPHQDETRKPRSYDTEAKARYIMKHLRERTFVAKRSYIRQRIKSHAYNVS